MVRLGEHAQKANARKLQIPNHLNSLEAEIQTPCLLAQAANADTAPDTDSKPPVRAPKQDASSFDGVLQVGPFLFTYS